ncbi:CCR4-Not complex component, Not1-domain-containing protein, partial [Chytridium lagenaria]
PSLKRIVYIAIDRAIREIISPVVERSVTIAGFLRLSPVKDRMRKSAHLMVQNLAALPSVSSREPLRVSMMSQLRSLLLQNGYTEQSIPEQVVYIIVADNLDLACSVMEKAAAEKATHEIDESLSAAYVSRRKHRERTNQPFYDVAIYAASRYPSSLPDPLRLKAGGLTPLQLRVYDDFSRITKSSQDASERLSRLRPENSALMNTAYEDSASQIQAIVEKYAAYHTELENLSSAAGNVTISTLPQHHDLRTLLRQIVSFFAQSLTRDEWLLVILQKIVRHMFSSDNKLLRDCYVVLLERLLDMSKRASREFSSWFLYSEDERKFNVEVTLSLLQTQVLSLSDLDSHLARLIECGKSSASEFALALIKQAFLDDSQVLTKESLQNCVEVLNKLNSHGTVSPSMRDVLDEVVKRDNPSLGKDTVKENDPLTLREKLGSLFLEWVRVYHSPTSNARTHVLFIFKLQQQGILGEDVVESYVKSKSSPLLNATPFQAVDAFAKLIVLLVRYNLNLMTNLMTKILSIVVLVLVHSHEQKRSTFNQRPFFRLFSSLLSELDSYDEQLQPLSFQILSAMSNTFHTLQPSFLPGFTFSWIQLISHRYFMPKLLLADNSKGWPFFQRLLVDLFKFLGPFLRENEMVETTRLLYKATLRILLVLLHDFPDAFPRNMRLPDPFTPNLKVDLLPEINQPPRVMSDYTSSLIPGNLKGDIDTYLKTRGPVSFLLDLRGRLISSSSQAIDGGTKYNVPVINALVLYVGVQAITQAQSKPLQGSPPITHSAPMDIFQQLIVDLDTEGRYLFIGAIANQLRYPNSHTHYFSCVLLYLFAEANQEIIQEQITRVLIERLIVNRPHPYGLLITFIELIRNPRYSFWDHTNFIRCAPEIERLFSSVAKSIQSSLMRA